MNIEALSNAYLDAIALDQEARAHWREAATEWRRWKFGANDLLTSQGVLA